VDPVPDPLTYILTPWPESASELYRPSDRRLSATLVPTFVDRGCHVVSVADPYGRNIGFLARKTRYLDDVFRYARNILHYFSESLVAPAIERGPLDL
jgi:hypothetical protein